MMRTVSRATGVLMLITLAACTSTELPKPAVWMDPVPGRERVAAVNAAAGAEDKELTIQPLRDSQVEDLREQALYAFRQGNVAGAAMALDHALKLVENDPGLLQERAELALLMGEPVLAEQFAHEALALGSQTGPLCRRHWATVWQSWLARNDAANAQAAQVQIDSCTVPVIQRF